jgi:hypothetical protein
MSKRTPIYKFLYLERGDEIYPGYDQDNMQTIENQIYGMYSYLGQGIINGWQIMWMGCKTNPYVMQQRQALINAYNLNTFSYLALEYVSIGKPTYNDEVSWGQCIVVTTGLGIIGTFYAATEQPSFFRFTTANNYYIWAQENACTNTEHLCAIVAPLYPDPDYDLYNQAIYLGEVFVNTVNSNISVTQIAYGTQRRTLTGANSEIQQLLQQVLINHVHDGSENMPSKINLSSSVIINVPILDANQNAFIFTPPSGSGFAPPQVYLNSSLLQPNQYQITGNILYLQNSVPLNSNLQIIYNFAPGNSYYINATTNAPLYSTTLTYLNSNGTQTAYIITDGTFVKNPDESETLNIFTWSPENYSQILVYLNGQVLNPFLYKLNNTKGTIIFTGPIIPSISNYQTNQVVIKFVLPEVQVTNTLPSSRIKSIDASSITSGTIPNYRIAGLDHLGFFRLNSPAVLIPYKKLLDSGDHINFYPEIQSPIQNSDVILYATFVSDVKLQSNESSTPSRTIISTPNGLYSTTGSPQDFVNITEMNWFTDNGDANEFSENYFGNFNTVQIPGSTITSASLNPKYFWVLSKSTNQFTNVLYLSTNYGISFAKITLPLNSSNQIVTINDFIATVNVYITTTGDVILTPHLNISYIFYLACSDGLYSTTLDSSQNPLQPIWVTPDNNTTNYATGSINKISEAVNVGGTVETNDTTGQSNNSYITYRNLYAACNNGLFVYNSGTGTLFTTVSGNTSYNQNGSIFSYVYWLGSSISDSSNQPEALIWGDSYGCYYSNSAQIQVISNNDGNTSTTTTTFYQNLTTTEVSTTVQCASFANPYLGINGNIDITKTITVIDGRTLQNGDLVLLKNQTDTTKNGIYAWSSTTKMLYLTNTKNSRILVQYGSQANTEWIEGITNPNNSSVRNFLLYYAKLFTINSTDSIVSVCKDASSGPNSNLSNQNYYNSFFVATKTAIYRVLNWAPNILPVVIPVAWNVSKYGNISSIQHYYNLADVQNGLLVVFTTNGIFKSQPDVFSLGNLSYTRYIKTINNSQESANITIYDEWTGNQYIGKILSLGLSTTLTTAPNGTYLNQRVFVNNSQGSGLSVNLSISNGLIINYSINNPGMGYSSNIPNGFSNINNNIIQFLNINTEGVFTADINSQAVTFTLPTGINPSRLLYEIDYTNFYTQPWVGNPLILVNIGNVPAGTQNPYTYDSTTGLIKFTNSLYPWTLKNQVTVTLSNIGQYIANTGNTPHEEKFNLIASQPNPAAKLASTYDPTIVKDYVLPIDHFDNTLWSSSTTVVKIVGQRASIAGSNILQPYTEIISVSVSMTAGKVYILPPLPSSLPLTSGSLVYIGELYSDVLGIEDEISLAQSKHTYHLNSVSHANVYNLYNALSNIKPSIFTFPAIQNEILTGVDRGLKNTIGISTLLGFDPTATFVGYTFGVTPSSSDIAAAPSVINLILDFQYGNNPIFATDKGVWTYIRANNTWIRLDTIGNSTLVYFANKTLTDSTNTTYTFAGTNLGLFYKSNGIYVQNTLFTQPVISLNMGSWYTSNTTQTERYEAYGKQSGLSFILRTTTNSTGAVTLKTDYWEGHQIYDIYYDTFYRYDENNNKTTHPAIYLATDYSVWAFTTDAAPDSSTLVSPHTLLYGREMFGNNIILNINTLNSALPGLPAKVFKILPIPSGGSNTWLVFCTSNGVYVVINWKECDVADPNGLVFYPQNKYSQNLTIRHNCYCITAKTNDKTQSIYFVGTEIGVYKSINKCGTWSPTSKFNNQQFSVSDLKYFTDSSNNGYLVAATNFGLWVTKDDGDTWYSIQDITDINDVNIQIITNPVYGVSLNLKPQQVFQTTIQGSVAKAFAYLNPQNLNGSLNVYGYISNGVDVTQSTNYINLNGGSYPGMYGFAFTNCQLSPNQNYYFGITSGNSSLSQFISWELSNLNSPFALGYAQTIGGTLSNQDFYFNINLNTPANVTQIIEPVGFYNNSYAVGFASGTFLGASISTQGYLYSNVGLIVNVILDTSKSIEINDSGIITQAGVSTGYVKQAVINALTNSSYGNLYTNLSNGLGTSKLLVSVYGYDETVNDLLAFYNTGVNTPQNCFNTSTSTYEGYTNSTSLLQSILPYIINIGRGSRLYDTVLFNSRTQYPSIIPAFYGQNLNLVDTNFININSVIAQYKSNYTQYLNLNLVYNGVNAGISSYTMYYPTSTVPFLFGAGDYNYGLVIYSNSTYSVLSNISQYVNGIYYDSSGKTPTNMLLSYDWAFDENTGGLSTSYNTWMLSGQGLQLALQQYANSFKPLIIVTTDGDDTSQQANPLGVNSSLKVAWNGSGTQVLVVSPSSTGNENILRDMIDNTNSKILKYSSYPESLLVNTLITNDSLNLFTSYWNRNYDFNSSVFISYIFASYITPGNSTATVTFTWSKDRINYSSPIQLPNGTAYYLNQQVLCINYTINFKESYSNERQLPYVTQLYHVSVIPSIQTYLSYPQTINGQLFETLAMASFANNNLTQITPIVGRTGSIDISNYQAVQLNRQSAVINRQSSFKVTPAYTVTGLLLLPIPESDGTTLYKRFFVVDNNENIYTWTIKDTFTLYYGGQIVAPNYITDPTDGIIIFQNALNTPINGTLQYQLYSGILQYSEKQQNIIGEPTTTIDYKTYYLKYGIIPPDATVVVLINKIIFKGQYHIDYFDGSITFASTRNASDYVTVFIKFANTFRVGLQVQSYSSDNLALQSFNFTYTSLPDLQTYADSFNIDVPFLSGNPILNPVNPNIDSLLQVKYNYQDSLGTPENGSQIYWWRQRTGIEYVTYDPNYSLIISGGSFNGINTFNVLSQANQAAVPFILSVTTYSIGLTTYITNVYIADRGTNFTGLNTSVQNSVVLGNGITISNIGLALSAFVVNTPYSPGYVTTNNYVRITPGNSVQYSQSIYGLQPTPTLSNFPLYDSRITERTIDINSRTLFDERDNVYVTIAPNNGYSQGIQYQSNVVTIANRYTPSVNNVSITPGTSSFDGINTTFSVSQNNSLSINYYYNPGGFISTSVLQNSLIPNANNLTIYNWYKLSSTGPKFIINGAELSSGLITINDQIYCSLIPGVLNSDGTVGYGNTVLTNVYNVSN